MAEPPPVAVKTILELSQADIDGSTSLYAVRGCSRPDVDYGWEKKEINIHGNLYHIDIIADYYYNRGERNLEKIVKWLTSSGGKGCIYYVLNAPDIKEVTRHIEIYANTKGSIDMGYSSKSMPLFCKETDFKQVSAKFQQASQGVMPRNITSSDSAAAELWRRGEMGSQGGDRSRHSYGSSGWRTSRRKDGEPLSPFYRLKRRANSNPRRTGGRKNRRRSAASRSRKNYRRS